MLRLLARRLGVAAVTLLLVTMLVYALAQLTPGDPLADRGEEQTLGSLGAEQLAQLRSMLHLDEPLHRQYVRWLADVLRGDLGRSFHDRRPVAEKIRERLGVSLVLNSLALALMVGIAVPLGALAAWRPGSRLDRWAAAGTYAAYAVPAFWAALLLQIVFAVRLDWLPLAGLTSEGYERLGAAGRLLDRARHLVLPVACLGYGGLAYLSRFVRATLLDSTNLETVRAARARGLGFFSVLCRHGFRQAAVPMLTLAGFLLPSLVGGSVIVETVFAIPGLGRLFVDAVLSRDLPVLMGLTLLSGAATLGGIVLADLAYAVLDPRVRRSGHG